MKVSLCMIVKDEEEVLEECLESVKDLVDEIVIVDTGSTDSTSEIASKYAHVYAERPWNGFSDARNHSIDLASGDAIVVLDADERIILSAGWEKAKELLEQGSDGVAFLVENELPAGQLLRADRLWQVRMFLKTDYARYTGRVHNQLTENLKAHPRDGERAKFHQVDVRIYHLGYNMTEEKKIVKYEARIQDLLLEIEEATRPNIKSYYQFQTANAYFMVGNKEKCLEYAETCDLDKMTHENAYSLCLMAVHSCHMLNKGEEADQWAMRMMEIWPNEAMSFLMKGLSLLGRNPKGAYNFLGSVLAMCQLDDMGYKYILDPHYVAGAAGEAALALKRYGEAKELFRMHLAEHENPRIKQLEAAIIPMDEARAQGLVGEEGSLLEDPLGEEEVEIRDLRKTG